MILTGTTGKVWEATVQGELFVAYINNIQESASVLQIHHHKLTMSHTHCQKISSHPTSGFVFQQTQCNFADLDCFAVADRNFACSDDTCLRTCDKESECW